jgi:hypothetical protein
MVTFIMDVLLCHSHAFTLVLAKLALELCFRIFGRFLEGKKNVIIVCKTNKKPAGSHSTPGRKQVTLILHSR